MPLSQAPVGGGVVDRIKGILLARHVTPDDFQQKTKWSRNSVQRLFKQGIASPGELVPAFLVVQRLTGISRADLLQDILAIAVPNSKEVVTRLVVERMAKEGLDQYDVARLLKSDERVIQAILRGEEPVSRVRPAMASWLGLTREQLDRMVVTQRTRAIAPTIDAYVPPLSSLIVAACLEQTQRERKEAVERSLRSSSDDDTGSREEKSIRAAARVPDYSPSSWARKHGLSVRVLSALANGETLSQRSIRYGQRLAELLGVDANTFWAAMRRNRVMPANAWSMDIQRRLRAAYDQSLRTVKRGTKTLRVPETMRSFAERVGVRHDTLFHLMETGNVGAVQVVNREKIRRFLNMGHEEWFNSIKERPANAANGLGVPRHTRTQVSLASMADGDDEVRLLTLWRRAERAETGKEFRERLLNELAAFVRSGTAPAKSTQRKTRSHAD